MNSSHLVTSMSTHQHPHTHHNTHHPQPHTSTTSTSSAMYTKMPTTQTNSSGSNANVSNNKYNNIENYSMTANNRMNNNGMASANHNVNTSTPSSSTTTTLPTNSNTQSSAYKFAPGRRLAARQTLRLAIPKQPGDSQNTQFISNSITGATNTTNNNSIHLKHSSPSQLPPAPILKRTPISTPQFSFTPTTVSAKSTSPLESHQLPNVIQHSTTPACSITPSSSGSSKFLRVRNPSITLNSSDVSSTHDLFAFAKEFSSPTVGGGVEGMLF